MRSVTVLYDDDCGFCAWSVSAILRWERRGALRALAIQDPGAEALLAGMPPERRLASWHLVEGDGRVLSGGAAVPALARRLRGGRAIGTVAERFPDTTERVYRWIAARRARFGRALGRRACSVDLSARGGSAGG